MGRIVQNAAASLAVTLVLLLPRGAGGDDLRGPAFSDPSGTHVPDPLWTDRPIHYTDDFAGADLVVDMNQQLYPFLLPVIEDFAEKEKIRVEITEGTCGKAAGKLSRKEVDISGFCCPPGDLDRLPGLRYHTLGISPLAILVNPENRVEGISLDQARKIFQGTISTWSSLGGDEGKIEMIASLHCAKRPGHWRLLLDNENLFSTRFREVGDMPDQIRLIASTPHAIGYETLWVAARFQDKGKVKGLRIDGKHPSDLETLEKGVYPLYRVYNVTTWEGKGKENAYAGKLVELLIEKAGELDPKYGIVSSDRLRRSGWKFNGEELVGEPVGTLPL